MWVPNMMRYLLPTCAGLFVYASAHADSPIPNRTFDQDLADSMVQQCAVRPSKIGWPPFSIAVVDAQGILMAFRRQEGAFTLSVDVSVIKARTSARVGLPSAALVALTKDQSGRDLFVHLQMTDLPGGLPLKQGGHLVGAIGVSGGTAEQDVGCANVVAAMLTQ
jgi:uncharacterized protein GlcG (DUF336 family)